MLASHSEHIALQFNRTTWHLSRSARASYLLRNRLATVTPQLLLADRTLIRGLNWLTGEIKHWQRMRELSLAAQNTNASLFAGDIERLKLRARNCAELVFALHAAALRLDASLGLARTQDVIGATLPGGKKAVNVFLDFADRADLRASALAAELTRLNGYRPTTVFDAETAAALHATIRGNLQRRALRAALRRTNAHVGITARKPDSFKVRFDTGLVAEALPDEVEVFECERCGASMQDRIRRSGKHFLSCTYCGHKRELAAPAGRVSVAQDLRSALQQQGKLLQPLPDMTGWRCNECGAEAVTSSSGIVARCAYCGSSHFTRIEGTGVARPHGMLRFACDQDRAEEMIREYLRDQPDTAFGFARDFEVETAQARYVPYWVFNLTQATGEGASHVCSCASRQLLHRLPEELRAIEPFPLAVLPPFEPSHLAGTVAERYSVDVEEALAHSFKLGEEGRRELAGINTLPDDTDVAFRYVLVPVWFFVLRWKGVEYHALVDGSGAGVGIRYPKTRVRAVLRRIPALAACMVLVPGLYFGMQYLEDLAHYRAESERMAAVAAEIKRNQEDRAKHLAHEQALRERAGIPADAEVVWVDGTPTYTPPAKVYAADTSFEVPVLSGPRGVHAQQTYTATIRLSYTAQSPAALESAQAAVAQADLRNALKALLIEHTEGLYLDSFGQLVAPSSAYWLREFEKAAVALLQKWRLEVERKDVNAALNTEYLAPPGVVYVEGWARNLERRFVLTLKLPEDDDRADWVRRMSHGDLLGEVEREIAARTLTQPRREHARVAREAAVDALQRWLYMRSLADDTLEILDFEVQPK